jgi:hypothetical protein
MSLVGFEPTIPAPKRAKTVHALDDSATVTGEWTTVTDLKTHSEGNGGKSTWY